jgi:hypothetical protein
MMLLYRDADGKLDLNGAAADSSERSTGMATASCECGMTLEDPAQRTGCRECGAAGCRSCIIIVDAVPYCRWCAVGRLAAA